MPRANVASNYTQDQLDAIWDQLKAQVSPFVYVLCIEGPLYRVLDDGAKQFIAKQFMEQVTERVMYCRDGTDGDRYFLGSPRFFLAGSGMIVHALHTKEAIWVKRPDDGIQHILVVPPALPKKCAKIPRPPNAYILYRSDRHRFVKASQPGIHNNEISQILGRAWNLESEAIRAKYKQRADAIKAELIKRHPEYKYRPRRPSERRRRRIAEQTEEAEDALADIVVDASQAVPVAARADEADPEPTDEAPASDDEATAPTAETPVPTVEAS
ncbi:mating type 2 HMG1/2 protein [Dactylonectria macrodidyma]|uniref:Mating type 2 HMG1/2 protein n=1 Tax=Dactylonectria macrodidyma TaxID=307937 RepID=A0A9P9FTH9_9HYPO|nr:mating type 2 HMG1/2 protein [Dactylonectria macrodidyma]